jgi:small GTP-binding protein
MEGPRTRCKAVFIGDSGVGKSSLYSRLESNTYDEEHLPTVGGSFAKITIPARSGGNHEVGLWDTAGQERYKDVIPMYFERADFILAVCAVNDRPSFEHLSDWISCARDRAEETVKVIVIGNKCDICQGREIDVNELMQYVASCGAVLGMETSAKSSAGLDLLIQGIGDEWEKTLEHRTNQKSAEKTQVAIVDVEEAHKRKTRCC